MKLIVSSSHSNCSAKMSEARARACSRSEGIAIAICRIRLSQKAEEGRARRRWGFQCASKCPAHPVLADTVFAVAELPDRGIAKCASRPINTGNETCQRYRTPCCDSTRRYRASCSTNFTTIAGDRPPFAAGFDERKSVMNWFTDRRLDVNIFKCFIATRYARDAEWTERERQRQI
jgi:hypothetical protein